MDTVAAFLDGPRAHRAFILRAVMDPPWAIDVRDEAPLALVVVTSGHLWLRPASGAMTRLERGDVALLRGPDHYVVGDDPATPTQVIVGPDQRCTSPEGEPLSEAMSLGVNTWGNSATGETTMLVGAYHGDGELGRWLTRSLPPVGVLRAGTWDDAVVDLILRSLLGGPGTELVLDRLLDVLLVSAVRARFADPQAQPPAWHEPRDPLVARAIALIHDDPAHPWTLPGLARAVGLSRAAFARRFREGIGESPMGYLTRWRMALAADLIRDPGATVGSVASRVGYATPFAFSAAFKRHHGRSPSDYAGTRRTA